MNLETVLRMLIQCFSLNSTLLKCYRAVHLHKNSIIGLKIGFNICESKCSNYKLNYAETLSLHKARKKFRWQGKSQINLHNQCSNERNQKE